MGTEMVDSVKYTRDSESCEGRVLEILARRSSMMVQILRGDGLINEDQRLVRLWLNKVPRIVRLILRLSVFVAAAIGARAIWVAASGNPDLVHAFASVLMALVFLVWPALNKVSFWGCVVGWFWGYRYRMCVWLLM